MATTSLGLDNAVMGFGSTPFRYIFRKSLESLTILISLQMVLAPNQYYE